MEKHHVGIIGYGAIGRHWAHNFAHSPGDRWQVDYVCDIDPARLAQARKALPGVRTVQDAGVVMADSDVEAVCLSTTADARPLLIRQALAAGKHIVAEKPIGPNIAEEEALLAEIEASDRLVAVNLFNRNGWYHHEAQAFIADRQIGKLGVVRVWHLTAGLMPDEAHFSEGPCFHDCGMHYVDVARWYAGSEYAQWHAQGVRMWGEAEPWYVSVQGAFENGVVFQITQGFVYGQLAEKKINASGTELIGTKGVIRMSHDFVNATLQMHGVGRTVHKTDSYGGKKFDVMIDVFTRSLDAGKDLGLPAARDSVIASRVSQQMHDSAKAQDPPSIGTAEEMQEIVRSKQPRPGR